MTEDDHLRHVQNEFNQLCRHKIKLNLGKCDYFMKDIHNLGFTVNMEVIMPDNDKVTTIKILPFSKTINVFGFIGMS